MYAEYFRRSATVKKAIHRGILREEDTTNPIAFIIE